MQLAKRKSSINSRSLTCAKELERSSQLEEGFNWHKKERFQPKYYYPEDNKELSYRNPETWLLFLKIKLVTQKDNPCILIFLELCSEKVFNVK